MNSDYFSHVVEKEGAGPEDREVSLSGAISYSELARQKQWKFSETANCQRNYDYVLFVGPGRSGTTYIYRILRSHYNIKLPELKEAYYFRRPKRLQRA